MTTQKKQSAQPPAEPVEADVWVPFQLIMPEQVAVFEQRYK
ncbi:hypothetical protein [Pseudomonas sp. TH39(2020)]|nr:hypothetical protein [Pseudomonas sp. TH39(2020)]